MLGFTTRSLVEHNEISGVPWSRIAIGWGWDLLDPSDFLGLPNATHGLWGTCTRPTPSRGNRIIDNRIRSFLETLWDGGAIYTVAQQGRDARDGELIAGNVATDKRTLAGGNVIYTDGGSRYVTIERNVLLDNPPGITNFGPCGLTDSLSLCAARIPYGSDRGGCRPYGDLVYRDNYWQHRRRSGTSPAASTCRTRCGSPTPATTWCRAQRRCRPRSSARPGSRRSTGRASERAQPAQSPAAISPSVRPVRTLAGWSATTSEPGSACSSPALDGDPAAVADPRKAEPSIELVPVQNEREVVGLVAEYLGGPLVPDDHRAAAALRLRVAPLELAGLERVGPRPAQPGAGPWGRATVPSAPPTIAAPRRSRGAGRNAAWWRHEAGPRTAATRCRAASRPAREPVPALSSQSTGVGVSFAITA